MKTASFGLIVVLLLLSSAAAHAFLGWPAMLAGLEGSSVNGQVLGALAVGWYFGSASMLAFALVVAVQVVRRIRSLEVDRGSLWAVALVYLVFGTAAFIMRDFNPHFLVFVATGALVGLFAYFCGRPNATRDEPAWPR